MVYAVAVLLISSLTSVGLLAIWAATSHAHWFWRTMGFLAAISPVLLIPAYEPFVAFVIQAATVAGGVQFAKWRAARRRGEPFFKSQFSLRTALLVTAPVALLVAVAVRVPILNWYAWQSVALIGLGGGTATLAAWWIASGSYDNWKVRGLLTLLIVPAVSLALACGDYFIYAMDAIAGWPPDPATMGLINLYGTYADGAPVLAWTPILLVVMVLLTIGAKILPAFRSGIPLGRLQKTRYSFGAILLIVTSVPAAVAFSVLMNPLPLPRTTIPDPNGYNDFEAAAKLLPANPMVNGSNFDAETATEQELKQATDEMMTSLDRVRQGLARPAMITVDYTVDDLPSIGEFRTMARGFAAQGRLLLKKDQPDKAVDTFLEGADFGVQLSKGGLLINDLVGIACTGVACRGLYAASSQVSVEQIPRVIAELKRLETDRDPPEDVIYRDRVWSQRAYGWYGHLLDVMSKSLEEEVFFPTESYVDARNRDLAILRLLQVELAVRLWQAERSGWPETLDELAPKYIGEIPVDPLSPTGERLKLVRRDSRLIIYSVGQNHTDEQGKEADDEGGYDPFTGDFRLDIFYAPEPTTPVSTATQPLNDESDEDTEAP